MTSLGPGVGPTGRGWPPPDPSTVRDGSPSQLESRSQPGSDFVVGPDPAGRDWPAPDPDELMEDPDDLPGPPGAPPAAPVVGAGPQWAGRAIAVLLTLAMVMAAVALVDLL